jgi:uncharacterized RDD family membrane protein YckC
MNKADLLHRVLAKLIDALIVGALCTIPKMVGVAAGATYILISDGFFGGQSVGKKLIGLRVVVRDLDGSSTRPCTFKDSLIRNLVFCAIVVLASIPLLGILFLLLGLVAIAVETYFVYADDHGIRVGDIFAGTQVVDDAQEKA